MKHFATKQAGRRILVWLIWFMAVLVLMPPVHQSGYQPDQAVGLVVTHNSRRGPLFPWQARYRWKKWGLIKYRAWRRAYGQAKRAAVLARLALRGVLTMAQVVEWLTVKQVRYRVGALPVLYALLETLGVRSVINRHCRSQAEVDHGTVALVLVLNRLLFPLPLYQVADWVGQTVLEAVLGCRRPNSMMTAWGGPWMDCIPTWKRFGWRWWRQPCSKQRSTCRSSSMT